MLFHEDSKVPNNLFLCKFCCVVVSTLLSILGLVLKKVRIETEILIEKLESACILFVLDSKSYSEVDRYNAGVQYIKSQSQFFTKIKSDYFALF